MENSIQIKIRLLQRFLLDQMVARYPGLGLEDRAEFFVRIFERFLEPESRILDIGGGWGFYAAPLESRGHQHVVLDVTKPGLQHAPVVLYSGEEPMPFPDKSFDASLLITVLHHVKNPAAMIEEVKRVTRKQVVVVEDTYSHTLGRWWTQIRDQLYNFEFFGHPGNFKKESEWVDWFRELGLESIHTERAYTWLSGLRILNSVMVFDVNQKD